MPQDMPIDVQLHLWPWSRGIREETPDLSCPFKFWGSPVVSLSRRATLYLPRRHERFLPFGPPFDTRAGEYLLYETPHGVLAAGNTETTDSTAEIRVHIGTLRESIRLRPQGAKRIPSQYGGDQENEGTRLASIVIDWSQFFDDLLDKAKKAGGENRLSWAEAIKSIFDVAEDAKQPRKALIVDIAERMRSRLPSIVAAARRILYRERLMLPAGRIAETDTACLRWMVRQPGDTMALKAAANRQRLLGIARRESFDTLENRVLKDFIVRCAMEGRRYDRTEVGDNPGLRQSQRACTVRQYQNLCAELSRMALFDGVAAPPPVPQPNYVLQNDLRYRAIWHHYVRLLKREEEEDCLWDWQARTWADVCRFLVCAALFSLSCEVQRKLFVEEQLASAVNLVAEQRLGCRILAGSEPGPFLVGLRSRPRSRASILEVVHPEHAGEHPATRLLGRTGGHLYFVLTPLDGGRRLVLIIWAVHTAAAKDHPSWKEIGLSAGNALQAHFRILDELGDPLFPLLRGFVVASDMDSMAADLHPGMNGDLHLVQVAIDQRYWSEALNGIMLVIEDILESVL